jgi:hypothetical protein
MPRRAAPDNSLPDPPEPTRIPHQPIKLGPEDVPEDEGDRFRAAIRLIVQRLGPHIIPAETQAHLDALLASDE